MSRLVVLFAFSLAQAQPLVGAVLCQGHHDQPGATCHTTAEHHPSGNEQSRSQGEHSGDEQCAAIQACAAATPVLSADGADQVVVTTRLIAMPSPATDRAPLGLRSPPFHPPKS